MKNPSPAGGFVSRFPGTALCIGIALVAYGLEDMERIVIGKAFLETLNIALILGVLFRSSCKPATVFRSGIRFCSKTLLNIAIVLLGTSFSLRAVWSAGPKILLAVLGIVVFSIMFTCWAGRINGLSGKQTLLVACGDSICGNSAIMAAASVIHATEEDVGTTIAFTAAGGLVVVLGLPVLLPLLHMSGTANGTFAGLTVYAVPQVMAAAAPFGMAALHIGTLVKLMRVLMLGPVCAILSLAAGRKKDAGGLSISFALVPWYIAGFIGMIVIRSIGVIPETCITPLSQAATFLTVLAMAALGLGIDIRSILQAGRPLVLTVVMSLSGLIGASIMLVRILNCS